MRPTRFTPLCIREALPCLPQIAFQLFFLMASICLILAATVPPTFAAQVTLAWDAPAPTGDPTADDINGYRVYLGTEASSFSQTLDAGSQTTYTVDSLADGTTYYFATRRFRPEARR